MDIFGMSLSYLLFSILHFFQFVLGLTIIGLYGQDVSNARKENKYADSKWIFGVVVGSLSAVTAILLFIPFILRFAAVGAWSLVIFALNIALFGLFGGMYLKERSEGDSAITRMKRAVWVDLASALLWLMGTVAHASYWWSHRERHSRFTGRANVGHNASLRRSKL